METVSQEVVDQQLASEPKKQLTREEIEEQVKLIPLENRAVMFLNDNLPKFVTMVENFGGSIRQLKALLIKQALEPIQTGPDLSYPDQRQIYELNGLITNAKLILFHKGMSDQESAPQVSKVSVTQEPNNGEVSNEQLA